MPDNRVDELDETGESSPKHVNACPSVPRLEMPWKGNEGKYETKESDDREEWVSWISHTVMGGEGWETTHAAS